MMRLILSFQATVFILSFDLMNSKYLLKIFLFLSFIRSCPVLRVNVSPTLKYFRGKHGYLDWL